MDSDEIHEMRSAGIISKPGVRRSDWKSGGDGGRLPEHGVGRHTWLHDLNGNSLLCKEQSKLLPAALQGDCCERQRRSY